MSPTPYQTPETQVTDQVMPTVVESDSPEDVIAKLDAAGYSTLAQTIRTLLTEFPDIAADFTAERVQGWIDEISGGGGRTEDDLRDDIFQYIVTPEGLMEKYGIDRATAMDIVSGGNDGGINFSDFLAGTPAGDQDVRPGFQADDPDDEPFVGDEGTEDEPGMTIVTSADMKWFFDDDSNKWFVGYTLPGSGRLAIFEADAGQMDSLFGKGMRPTNWQPTTYDKLIRDPNNYWGGDISEVEGTGQFEDQYHREVNLALEGGELPLWAQEDGAAMDILYMASAEDWEMDRVILELSKTDAFKLRFPGLEHIQSAGNLTLEGAIGGFLDMEAGIRTSLTGVGMDPGMVTPTLVGALLGKGHSLQTVDNVVQTFDRMKKFEPALVAFNGILAAQGLEQVTSLQDMFDFVAGSAPQELYDVWEASTLSEQAEAAGLTKFFSADDAIQVALQTAGAINTESITAAMKKSAEFALRLRHEINIGAYGLDTEDLIDMNLGQPLRSGRSQTEVGENIQRVLQGASAARQNQLNPFVGFTQRGTPQAKSFGSLRQSS